jgi:hypothetical protein
VVARWLRKKEPSERDLATAERMLGPDGDFSFAVLRVSGVDRVPDPGAKHAGAQVTGVVQFDLLPAAAVDQYLTMPTAKWLRVGDEVAVLVQLSRLAAGQERAVSVLWDRLPERSSLIARSARATAAELNGEPVDADAQLYRSNAVIGDPGRPLPGTEGGGTTVPQARALVSSGEPATGVVVDVTDVRAPRLLRGRMPEGASVVDVVFEVTREHEDRYRVRMRIGFSTPQRRARVATVGATVPLRVDPSDRDTVAVDTAALGFDG